MRAVGTLTDPAAPDKIKMPRMGHFYFILVGAAGFEPTLTESEDNGLNFSTPLFAPDFCDFLISDKRTKNRM